MSSTPCTDSKLGPTGPFRILEDLSSIGINDQMLEGEQLAMFSDEEDDFRAALSAARGICAACSLLEQCLFAAVTDRAVEGVVAGTTESDRERLRSRLGLKPPEPEDNDIYILPRRPHDAVDPDRITGMAKAGMMSQAEMAEELGCSTRTIRRRQRSSCNVRRRSRRNPLTSKKVLAEAEQLLSWF
ncbi:WhiB family transcriptional regulator [Streptomyces abikoensis]|uniref:WhiB family transcriptional regulator n=1 Tax=Streptomyces abikoensis TaxID=97398 RepID=UPI00340974BA